ncbi:MAG: peptidase [Candidatus Anammoximicrobium sp.]|mgnify:CR=1 FL=1|nr:peptidase [Candidatus Anammoximicrobium sp.]
MPLLRVPAILAVTVLLTLDAGLHAQSTKEPHVGYVYPAGGRQNSVFEVTVGGQFIKEANGVYISGSGVKAEIVKWYRPLTQGEYVGLSLKIRFKREELEEEQKKAGKTDPITDEMVYKAVNVTENDLKEMEIYRKRDADPKRQPNDQIAEELTLRITVDATAELGKREMRVLTPGAMSNPIWFQVSQWEERRETEPNDETPDTVIGSTLPVVVNGQIMPGEVDRFSFAGRKGTRLVIAADARELMPYLADAVPGWFQAVLALYDSQGNEVAYAGAFYYRQDPVIYYEVPQDGTYVLEVHDSIYRGREDFVYRITLGELPFVTGIFPLGARADQDVTVELQGWNLVETQLNVRARVDRNRPIRWYSIPQTDKVSIRFPLRIDMMTEIMEQEPNDGPETAQAITLPVIINGRIDRPDDEDVFRFDAVGRVVAEVYARRAGSPLDSAVSVTDATGAEIGFNDDFRDEAEPLITHHADSLMTAAMSGKGPYCLTLKDAQRKGGKDFIYRMYVRAPRPDLDLRVVPSCIMARPGSHVPITVHAIRREGFDDPIHLSLVDPPEGFSLSGAVVPGKADQVKLTLTVPPVAPKEPFLLEMEGQSRGSSRHRRFTRPVIPAESMMQAFLWLQIVPAEQWAILVNGTPATKPPLELLPVDRINIRPGGSTLLGAKLTAKYPPPNELRVELTNPPKGISVEKVSPEGPGLIVSLAADAAAAESGQEGNLIFEVVREWTPAPTEEIPKPQTQRRSLGILPAIPFQVAGQAQTRRK